MINKQYNVLWNQIKGTPLNVGNTVKWFPYTFTVVSIEWLPESKLKFDEEVHYFDNAKLVVETTNRITGNWLEMIKSGKVYVGPHTN